MGSITSTVEEHAARPRKVMVLGSYLLHGMLCHCVPGREQYLLIPANIYQSQSLEECKNLFEFMPHQSIAEKIPLFPVFAIGPMPQNQIVAFSSQVDFSLKHHVYTST